jgi:hypothetical protein
MVGMKRHRPIAPIVSSASGKAHKLVVLLLKQNEPLHPSALESVQKGEKKTNNTYSAYFLNKRLYRLFATSEHRRSW